MAAKLKEDVIRWKKKLDRNPDEEYILTVIHRLSKAPMTLEILQETHIGKCIRNLSKRDDIVGEKASAVLNKWRLVFTSEASSKTKHRNLSVKENIHKESSKSSSKYDVSREKTVEHHQKESSHHSKHKLQKNISHNSYPESSKKYSNGDSDVNSSDESSPPLYTYEKKEASSKYISYDPHSDMSEGYNPECPDLFPGGKSVKKKLESQTVDEYEPSSLKRKIKTETESVYESKSKRLKPDSHSNSIHNGDHKRVKQESESVQKDKSKSHSHKVDSLHPKKDSSDKLKSESNSKKSSHSSDSKKSKSKESNDKEKSSKSKAKLKLNSTEEFTSSEVRFEDCLGFNDIVIKKKKSAKPTPSIPKKAVSVNNKSSSSHTPGHTVPVKSSPVQKERLHVPKPKEDTKLEVVDIISTLPQTLPNYRPLPRVDMLGSKKKEVLSNEEAILYMSSKREKTAVYSGRRTFYTEVPTLLDLCTRILIENIDAIEYVGGMPFLLLKPVLEKCNPSQLCMIENYNPHLLDDTHDLWKVHCKRDYKLLEPEENETFRELYMRAHDERERKLKSITANISASMSKSNPVRQVKLAYVDSVAKPPRDVARRQAKNGTALPVSHPVKPGPASKATPRPVAPVINSSASSSSSSPYIPKKPKVAPLMAKTLKSMKQCFRRK